MTQQWHSRRPSDDPLRLCARCHVMQPRTEFRAYRHNRDGLASYCRTCQLAATQKWRAEHYDEIMARRRELNPYIPREPSYPFICGVCGETGISKNGPRKFCSPLCYSKARDGQRPLRKHHRQKILNRDGWRCYLCGKDIDRTRAYPHPLSGTVDHVLPVSAKGSDHPDNLRAAHWRCNRRKGADLIGAWVAA